MQATANAPTAPTPLTKELKEELVPLLQVDIEQVKARTPEQHKAAFKAMERAMKPGSNAATDAQLAARFGGADANKDKLLDLKEYLAFQEKERAAQLIRREPGIDRTREQHTAMFNVLNKITEDVDGLSLQDLRAAARFSSDHVFSSLGSEQKSLTDEVKAEVDKLMDQEVAAIKKWTRAEREASARANLERRQPSGRKAAGEEFRRLFAEADADEDRRLNLAEWLSFVEKSEAAKATRGEPSAMNSKEYATATFHALDKVTPGSKGVSMADIAAAFDFARTCVAKKLGPDFGREPPLSEEVRAMLAPVLQRDVDFIKAWTPEQRDAQKKIQAAKFASQAAQDEQDALFNDTFDAASKKKKGLLNRKEYFAFCTAYAKRFAEAGELCCERTQDDNATFFDALNKVSPDTAGLSKDDIREGFTFQQFFIKQGLNPLTLEIKAELVELAKEDLAAMNKWDAETEAKARAAEERMAADPEERKEMSAAFQRLFQAADKKKRKHLSKAEYLVFCTKMKAFQEEKGLPSLGQTKSYNERMWAALNKLNDEYQGVAPGDLSISRGFIHNYLAGARRQQAAQEKKK